MCIRDRRDWAYSEEDSAPLVNQVANLKVSPDYVKRFNQEYALPPPWKGNEIGSEIEIPCLIHGNMFKRPINLIFDRKANGNLIGKDILPTNPKPYEKLVAREYVILPWRGEGHPYTFNRTVRLEFKIDGIGTTEAIFGICPPIKDGIILGAPYAFQNKVTYSTHGNVEYINIKKQSAICEICESAYDRLRDKL